MEKNDWFVPKLYLIGNLHTVLVFTNSFLRTRLQCFIWSSSAHLHYISIQ